MRDGLTKLSITLLVDAEEIIDTRFFFSLLFKFIILLINYYLIENGKVQLIGLDYRHYDRYNHVNSTLAKFPRSPDVDYRLIMLHDPGASFISNLFFIFPILFIYNSSNNNNNNNNKTMIIFYFIVFNKNK